MLNFLKTIGKAITTVARATLVTVKYGMGWVARAVNTNKSENTMTLSDYWHSTLRPKGYERPREMTAEETIKAQNASITNNKMKPEDVKVAQSPVRREADRRYTQSTQPQMTSAPAPKM